MVINIPNPVKCSAGYWILPIYSKTEHKKEMTGPELEEEITWICSYTGEVVNCKNCPLKKSP